MRPGARGLHLAAGALSPAPPSAICSRPHGSHLSFPRDEWAPSAPFASSGKLRPQRPSDSPKVSEGHPAARAGAPAPRAPRPGPTQPTEAAQHMPFFFSYFFSQLCALRLPWEQADIHCD